MGILDRLTGKNEPEDESRSRRVGGPGVSQPSGQQLTDEQAVERYRYMLKTAPPETIEQAHEEAFSKLTPEQRRMVLEQLSAELPERERATQGSLKDDPQTLAQMATRTELRQPGTLERTFGRMGGGMGMGMGGLMAGSFLSSIAGVFVGSMIAQQFLGDSGFGGADSAESGSDQDPNNMETDQEAVGDSGLDAGDGGGFDDFGGDIDI